MSPEIDTKGRIFPRLALTLIPMFGIIRKLEHAHRDASDSKVDGMTMESWRRSPLASADDVLPERHVQAMSAQGNGLT